MQTLLNATKANVWASIVDGRSFLLSTKGMRTALRSSCGMKAKRSNSNDDWAFAAMLVFGDEFK